MEPPPINQVKKRQKRQVLQAFWDSGLAGGLGGGLACTPGFSVTSGLASGLAGGLACMPGLSATSGLAIGLAGGLARFPEWTLPHS